MHEPGFWDSEARTGVLARVEYLDRLEAATRTARRLAGRLSSGRETHSRELVELLSRRLLVLARRAQGLAGGEPSDARVTLRPGHGDDAAACAAFAAELERDVHGLGGGAGDAGAPGRRGRTCVLEVSGLGAYTLLRGENGLHVLETPAGESSFDRATVVVGVAAIDAGLGEPGRRRGRDRAPLPARALSARPLRVRRAHGPDRPRARGRLRPDRGVAPAD